MNISIFEWAVQLLLDCIVSLFQFFRLSLDAIGPAWSVIVSLLVVFLLFRFILLPLFGKSFNIRSAASDTVMKIANKATNSNKKGGGD